MSEPKSATEFILRALLIPLSRENLLLNFKPGRFFYELSLVSKHSKNNIQSSYYRAKRSGLIELHDSLPRLTEKGRRAAAPFHKTKISNNGKLLVIFDIPEQHARRRHEFRRFLKRLGFEQVQLSVWVSDYDHRNIVSDAIKSMHLELYVQFYEAARLVIAK